MLTISLRAQYIFTIAGIPVTNTFLTSVIVTGILSLLSVWFFLHRRSRTFAARAIEALMIEMVEFSKSVLGDRNLALRVTPIAATFFLFIVTANLLALIPGFLGSLFVAAPAGRVPLLRSPNSDLTTTIALALAAVTAIQLIVARRLGARAFLRRFLNLANPLALAVSLFELLSELTKVLSFSFRLFGNLFAGEILLLVVGFLAPFLIPLPFLILELFVGAIQAFIFAVLTLGFVKSSLARTLGEVTSS